jgi:uncharacterized repeat protein (TIGR02543 family)
MKRFFARMAGPGRAFLAATAFVLALAACPNPPGGGDPVEYTIIFDSQGGSEVTAITANEGTAVEKPADPARDDYTFKGWYSAVTGGTEYEWPHTLNADVTMYARWQAVGQYTITFNSHDGSAVTAITANEGTAVEKPADPSRNGYTFENWYSAASGGTLYTWPHTLNADVTMHARWTPIPYTITYNLDGGTNPGNTPTSYTIETTGITLPTPTKTNYTFGGWFDNSGLTGTAVTAIATGSTSDKSFWAKWNESGSAGITISYWVNEQDQLSSTAGSANVTKTGTLTIAADGASYSDQHWYINGVEDVPQAGQASYSFSGAGKDTTIYTIGLRVRKDNQYYSTQFAVTVTD